MSCYSGCGGQPPAIIMFFVVAFVAFTAMAVTILMFVAWWKICRKAGFSGWLALLMLVPVVNIALPLIVAFMDWPVEQELRKLRQNQTTGTP